MLNNFRADGTERIFLQVFIRKVMWYNYIRENNFNAFSTHENIFTIKKQIMVCTYAHFITFSAVTKLEIYLIVPTTDSGC